MSNTSFETVQSLNFHVNNFLNFMLFLSAIAKLTFSVRHYNVCCPVLGEEVEECQKLRFNHMVGEISSSTYEASAVSDPSHVLFKMDIIHYH